MTLPRFESTGKRYKKAAPPLAEPLYCIKQVKLQALNARAYNR